MSWSLVLSCVLLAASVAVASPAARGASERAVEDDVSFQLYTWRNPADPEELFIEWEGNSSSTFFEPSNPTKVLIHGYTENLESESIQLIKDAYVAASASYNVIAVDWRRRAAGPLPGSAQGNVVPVGEYVAEFLNSLKANGVSFSNVHLIGFDLGAHVAGVAALRADPLIARVTGLDPTLSGFETENEDSMLGPNAAKYVDVIHTDAGQRGFLDPLGDADFYPNGGQRNQPGCGLADPTGSCSHSMCIHLYVSSIITPGEHGAHLCETLDDALNNGNCDLLAGGFMGDDSDSTMRGLYYVRILRPDPEV